MPGAIDTNELFDPEFLESLKHLRLVARQVPRGGRFAEQRSRDLGAGIEFKDYRPYAPGDDLRGVDWNVYRRLGKVFLRLFEELEDLPLYLLPDVSKSAFLETPPRAHAGLRCALALAVIGLEQHDSVGLFPFSDDLSVGLRPKSGKGRMLQFAQHLAALEPGGTTDLSRSLAKLEALKLRPGLVAIISDFFDPSGIEQVVTALKRSRHRLLLVQLTRASDREPNIQGDLRLRDCETGATEEVSITPALLERYRAAYGRFEGGLMEGARATRAGLLQLDVDAPVVPQLAALFEGGRYEV